VFSGLPPKPRRIRFGTSLKDRDIGHVGFTRLLIFVRNRPQQYWNDEEMANGIDDSAM
jgi:hypothetical protein